MDATPILAEQLPLRLLGAVQYRTGAQQISRWPSRAVALLLARLALWPQRDHPREELVELLWPGVEPKVARNRLRQALSTLRALIEAPGQPPLIQADRFVLRAAPGAFGNDARTFERLLRQGEPEAATRLYRGELMPGFYDDWVQDERLRLAALAERAERAAGAAGAVPPLRRTPATDLATPGAELPSYLTRYFGSEAQAARLRASLFAHRLVTLLGPGGSGKTRLAVELAQSLRDTPDFGQDGAAVPRFDLVAFVPLQACSDALQLLAALAVALRLPAAAAAHADPLVSTLGGRRALLVLDNFEQLVDAGAPLVAELLARLPLLHLLVTSRRALDVDGEHEFALAPLALPAADTSLQAGADSPALALFVDRARAVRADFHLGPRNLHAIVELVRALEGMPLALELAASRVRSLSPRQMVDMLFDGPATLDLLARHASRSGPAPRHASMRQVIEWSWRQLTPALQRALAGVTVFESSFSAEAAAQVLALDTAQAAALLGELAAQSLLRALPAGEETPRFSVYVPLREYAAESLPAGAAAALRHRLRAGLIGWAARRDAAGDFAAIHTELPQIHAALRSAAGDGDALQAVQLTLALRRYWDSDGMPLASLLALEAAALAIEGTAPAALRCDIHEMLSYLRFAAGFADDAAAHARAAVAGAGDDPQRRVRAAVRQAWVQIAGHRDGLAQQAPLRAALALAREIGDLESQARALHQLAIIEHELLQQPAAAEALLAQAQALWEQLGDRRKAQARLRNRAQCWQAGGRREQALASYRDCERAALADADWVGVLDSTLSQGSVLAELRQWRAAADATARCVAVCWQHHHAHGLGYALWNQARVFARLRRPEAAALLMAFAEPFWTTRFGPLRPADKHYPRRVRALVAAQLGPARTASLWAEGRALELAQAVALAREGQAR